ncbi:MAG TPA: glycosyltransferase [Ramlibacter sp.]|jgi:UDP-N-acetylmuramyl pentapeptide phosphotransferase/UDP-N-acetylglucosamine-1-phosphate transferase|uniref:glycosyltransferase family 4 protein n=1 Tax=Ramlibacter sp. TaxID=1917967 RepID=UPI002D6D8FE9|nr:glycosyltransferase [Ramlibacter sp.]HZY20078.1 glycosyltransferase [Ramlibacter sp.]
MLFLLIICGVVSSFACAALIRSGRRIAHRYGLDMPQRFHAGHIPRLGGVAMLAGCSIGWLWMVIASKYLGIANGIQFSPAQALAWCIPAMIAAGCGVAEDVWHQLRARWRLVFTLLAGVTAVLLLDLRIGSLGLAWLDRGWTASTWPAIAFAVLAIAGLPHAFNLIDGYNGLAGTVAMICSFAIAYVALQVGDREIAGAVLVLAGATAGFLVWNYPRGLIFAGDGGAYLWGAVIAMASILLTQRHREVSPWFPMLLLAYPVLETVFSIYRKAVRGQSPSMADALHFHQLIYRRIVREVFHDDESRRMLMRNNRTSPYLWGFAAFTVVPAVLFWQSTYMLMACTFGFVTLYVWAYTSIVRFKVPRWVRSRSSRF